MKRFVIPFLIMLILGIVGVSQAEQISFSVPSWSVGSGENTTGGDYKLSTIANQPIIGRQSGGDFDLKWGFFHHTENERTIYLPMVAKLGQESSSATIPATDDTGNP